MSIKGSQGILKGNSQDLKGGPAMARTSKEAVKEGIKEALQQALGDDIPTRAGRVRPPFTA